MFHSKRFPIVDPCLIRHVSELGRRIWCAGDEKINVRCSVDFELSSLSLGTWQSDRRNWSWVTNPSYSTGLRETFSGLFLAGFQGNGQREILSKGLLVIGK